MLALSNTTTAKVEGVICVEERWLLDSYGADHAINFE